MRTLSKKSKVIVAAATIGTLSVAGVAYAYYAGSVSGSTTGSATAAQSPIADVTPTGASSISGLVPAGSAVPTTVTLKNSNTFSVSIPSGKSVTLTSATGPVGCADNTVAELSGTAPIPAQTLAAGATTTVSVPVSMADDSGKDQSSCNGGTFTPTYSVTP